MSVSDNQTLRAPSPGRVFSIVTEHPREPLHWLALLGHEFSTKIVVYSRLSPQRLGQHINLEKIDFKWLSESMNPHALPPSLERIHHAISTRISSDGGLIWVDGVEFLIHRQGFDAFLSFTRSLADELRGGPWTVLLPYSPLSLEPTELAHLRREAIPFQTPNLSGTHEVDADFNETSEIVIEDVPEVVAISEDIVNDGMVSYSRGPKLLSSIPLTSFTPAVLKRRIHQWEEMGFDVSELQYAISTDTETGYAIYCKVEERVRRAVECERRIRMIEIRGHLVEATKMRFRILQLTGIDAIESRLDELLSGSI